jgi:4-hydroxybenzoyl-CoA thioesterase
LPLWAVKHDKDVVKHDKDVTADGAGREKRDSKGAASEAQQPSSLVGFASKELVIPAEAGTQVQPRWSWIPAFAGFRRNDGGEGLTHARWRSPRRWRKTSPSWCAAWAGSRGGPATMAPRLTRNQDMSKPFTVDHLVRFSHCDPAAIVYYPDFFDLQHAAMEDWFRDALRYPMPEMIRNQRIGVPTVSIQGEFNKPLVMGDVLHWEVRVLKLGRASVQLEYRGMKDGADHLKIVQTIVFMDLDRQVAVPIPEELRARIERFLV